MYIIQKPRINVYRNVYRNNIIYINCYISRFNKIKEEN